jgi:hypothetical protein
VREDGELRWGGDFTQEDPVHVDDNLNARDSARRTASSLPENETDRR